MSYAYFLARPALCAALLLAPAGAVLAQAPVITSIMPMANARAAARNAPLTVSFSQPLTAASAGALKVFSSQRGGLRTRGATPAVVSGSNLSFAPTAYDFRPGETVQYTVTTGAASAGGALAAARVGQFTAAVGGAGRGNFQMGSDFAAGGEPTGLAVGDVDGDGDIDVLTAVVIGTSGYGVNVRLNNGMGTLSSGQSLSFYPRPGQLDLQDADGDGDLDLLVALLGSPGFPGNAVGVCLNNGGTFGAMQTVGVNDNPYVVKMADVDGDGDLDLLALCGVYGGQSGYVPGMVSVRLNNGNGTFGGTQSVTVGTRPETFAVGDVDGDGDVDLAVVNMVSGSVSLRLNAGNGTFGSGPDLFFGSLPVGVALGDVDGDGDLDLAVLTNANGVNVRLNNGSGVFSGTQSVGVGNNNPLDLHLADVDADGDPDIVVVNYTTPGGVAVRLNNGAGVFGAGFDYALGATPVQAALADMDGDGDLDLLTGNIGANTIALRLNGGTGPLATAASHSPAALALFPNPAPAGHGHGAATLTGAAPYAVLAVLDALGRVRLTATADAAGTARLALPAGLPAGVYTVRGGGAVRRLVVE